MNTSAEILEEMGFEYVECREESDYWYNSKTDTGICACDGKIIGTNIVIETLEDLIKYEEEQKPLIP